MAYIFLIAESVQSSAREQTNCPITDHDCEKDFTNTTTESLEAMDSPPN